MLTRTSAMEWCKRNFFREESDFYGELSKCEAFEQIREDAGAKEYTVNEEKHEVYEKLRAKITERYRRENV